MKKNEAHYTYMHNIPVLNQSTELLYLLTRVNTYLSIIKSRHMTMHTSHYMCIYQSQDDCT